MDVRSLVGLSLWATVQCDRSTLRKPSGNHVDVFHLRHALRQWATMRDCDLRDGRLGRLYHGAVEAAVTEMDWANCGRLKVGCVFTIDRRIRGQSLEGTRTVCSVQGKVDYPLHRTIHKGPWSRWARIQPGLICGATRCLLKAPNQPFYYNDHSEAAMGDVFQPCAWRNSSNKPCSKNSRVNKPQGYKDDC